MLPGADFSDEDCIGDYKMRCEQRTTYPGASAFDFAAIFNIVIADILGWDEDKRCSFPCFHHIGLSQISYLAVL